MDFLANIVQQVLTVLYNFTESVGIPNLGLAIVLMTIIIKLIMYPLTQKQIQSTKAMIEIQPKMKALQEKYKDDKQRLNMSWLIYIRAKALIRWQAVCRCSSRCRL